MELTHRKMFLDDLQKVMKLQLRKEDQIECEAASGLSWEAALSFAVLNSDEVNILLLDGRIVGVFGLAADQTRPYCAAPWLLGSDELFSAGLSSLFSRGARDVVRDMRAKYKRLENFVAASNTKAVRFLEWLGFTLDPELVTLADPDVKFIKFWEEAV